MGTRSYWLSTSRLRELPALAGNLEVDVAVVGAGNTGIVTAYLLKRAGLKVALLERDRCGGNDTAHTSAHLTYITDLRVRELVRRIGRDSAQAVLDSGQAALLQIADIVHAERIACAFSTVPGFLHSSIDDERDERDAFKEEAELASDLGYEAHYMDSVPLFKRPGIRFPGQARFHPLKFIGGLLKRIAGEGSHIFERSEVTGFSEEPLSVKANGHSVRCNYIVIATDVPLQGNTGLVSATLFQSKLAPYTSYVISARVPPGSVPDALFWDTSDPYYFLRREVRGAQEYAIFGGCDHKTGQHDDPLAQYARLEARLRTRVPQAKVVHRWSGQVIEAVDGLPYIGETAPRQFVATGFSGNGLTFGTLAAMMACDAALGRKNPWSELYHVDRKRFGAIFNYLAENADYPYYIAREWLRRAEETEPDALRPGEGKLLKIDGKKMAVYKAKNGTITKLSPVCTHLGCAVRWNDADSTWDCPCHGSRFRATGEVLAGPAERGLKPAEEP